MQKTVKSGFVAPVILEQILTMLLRLLLSFYVRLRNKQINENHRRLSLKD